MDVKEKDTMANKIAQTSTMQDDTDEGDIFLGGHHDHQQHLERNFSFLSAVCCSPSLPFVELTLGQLGMAFGTLRLSHVPSA